MPWLSLLGFLRIATNPRILIRPQSASGAVKQMQDWLANDLVWVPQPGARHAEILGRLLVALNSGGDMVPASHLAALAIAHGLIVCSADADFARFANVRWLNPLA